MRGTTSLFSRLIKEQIKWTPRVVAKLPKKELQALAYLLCIPTSLTKPRLCERLLSIHALRLEIGSFGDDPQELMQQYKRRELVNMCRVAKKPRSGNKYRLSSTILGWRNTCRHKGQKRLAEAREIAAKGTKQLTMRF